jgi:hypothetical protein
LKRKVAFDSRKFASSRMDVGISVNDKKKRV